MKTFTFGLIVVFGLLAAGARAANLSALGKPGLPEGRIINGQDAVKGEAPFIVSLQRGYHFCAGSIIDEHWVLTAAHCLTSNSFEVVAGLHKLNDRSSVQVRKVPSRDYYIVHEDFTGGVGPNDIGLIYIAEPFDLNAFTRDGNAVVDKVELPSGKYSQTGEGRLFGWGRDITNTVPNTLQTLGVKIIDYKECKAALPLNSRIDPVNICSYERNSIDGACNGDSGGPLLRTTRSGYELVGIVSWGYTPCQTTKYPSVYTSTVAYDSWIAEKTDTFVLP